MEEVARELPPDSPCQTCVFVQTCRVDLAAGDLDRVRAATACRGVASSPAAAQIGRLLVEEGHLAPARGLLEGSLAVLDERWLFQSLAAARAALARCLVQDGQFCRAGREIMSVEAMPIARCLPLVQLQMETARAEVEFKVGREASGEARKRRAMVEYRKLGQLRLARALDVVGPARTSVSRRGGQSRQR